jgi:hypothetical protein
LKRPSNIFANIIAGIIILMGLYFLALWLNNIAHRVAYPFPIEYLEDAIFFHALRIYDGRPLYIDPNDGFASIIYVPGYFYLLAGVYKILGPSIVTARFISLLSTIGMMALLLSLSFRRMRSRMALIPLFIYLSLMYAHFAGYQDLGRVDPLMVLMVLGGLFIIGDGRTGMKRVLPGVLLISLACYVKQPALAYLPFVYAFIIFRDRKAGVVSTIISLALLIGIFFAANSATNGWFGYYTLKLPATHWLRWDRISTIIFGGYVHYPVRGIIYLLISALIYFIFRICYFRRIPLNIIEAALPGAAIATILPYMKEGGYFQDFLPLHTHLCFLLPYALAITVERKAAPTRPAPSKAARYLTMLILLSLVLHCYYSLRPVTTSTTNVVHVNIYDHWTEFLPKNGNIELGWDFVEKVKGIDGEVLMPSLGYYAWLAGREPGYVGVALTDLLGFDVRPEPLIEGVRSGRYAAICLPEYFVAEEYWKDSLADYGYSGPFELIKSLRINYNLRPTIEIPPNLVYLRSDD